jgi:HEAT repeat protein
MNGQETGRSGNRVDITKPDGSPGRTSADGRAESEEEYQKELAYYLERLEDENEGVRWKAAESLGRLGDPAAVEPLIDTLWDDDYRVRMKAAWALGLIGDPRALPPLQRLYRIENENVREIIERAMNDIKRQMSGGEPSSRDPIPG